MTDLREQEQITREYYEQGKGYDMSTAELNRQRGIISGNERVLCSEEHYRYKQCEE